MAEFPALPLWTDSYLADCGHLTDAEHGRYLLLLMAMWRSPECRVPNDDEWLARRFRRSVEEIESEFRPLIAEFCQSTGNWITQKRLVREHVYVRARSKKQSDNAKSRWKKEKPLCHGNAPTPTPTPTITEEDKSSSDAGAPINPQRLLYTTGKQVLGSNAGGLVTKLLRHCDGDCDRALNLLRRASSTGDPRDYLGGILRGETQSADVIGETESLYRRLGVR